MTKLLSDRIRDLHLRPDAPYPSEVRDAHDLILQWRRTQRLHSVRNDDDMRDRDSIAVLGNLDDWRLR